MPCEEMQSTHIHDRNTEMAVGTERSDLENYEVIGSVSALTCYQASSTSYSHSMWTEDQQFLRFPNEGTKRWDDDYYRSSNNLGIHVLVSFHTQPRVLPHRHSIYVYK